MLQSFQMPGDHFCRISVIGTTAVTCTGFWIRSDKRGSSHKFFSSCREQFAVSVRWRVCFWHAFWRAKTYPRVRILNANTKTFLSWFTLLPSEEGEYLQRQKNSLAVVPASPNITHLIDKTAPGYIPMVTYWALLPLQDLGRYASSFNAVSKIATMSNVRENYLSSYFYFLS